jgi:hypothetical protein
MSLKYEEITEAIIGSAFEVHNILGYGFLESEKKKLSSSVLFFNYP